MFDFYKENLKFYLKIAWYRYLLYLALFLPIFLLATMVVFLLRRVNIELFNIAVTSIALAPIIIGGIFLLALLLKFLFLSGYSIAKHFEEIYFPGKMPPLRLSRKDKALHFIQEIRDEAHRFAIKYNRLLRKKELIS